MLERMEDSKFGYEMGPRVEFPQDDITLTLGRAISNVEDAKHAVSGNNRSFLEGQIENYRGASGWLANQTTKAARLLVLGSMVGQMATACAPRTATAQDMIAATTAITENYTPTPAAEFTPEIPVIKGPTKDASGNYFPVSERFADLGLGKIVSIEKADPSNPVFDKILQSASEKFKVDSEDIILTGFTTRREKGGSLYVLVANRKDGSIYSVFGTDENDLYLPPGSGEKTAFLPMMEDHRNGETGFGFAVDGSLLLPPTFVSKDGKLTFTDPGTGEQVDVPLENIAAAKVLALLTSPKESIGIGEPTPTASVTETAVSLSPEEQAVKDFTDLGVTADQYTISKDKDGTVHAYKADNKAEIYKDGKFNYDYIFSVARQTCEVTDMRYMPGTNVPYREDDQRNTNYFKEIVMTFYDGYNPNGNTTVYPIKDTKYCWVFADNKYFYFRDKEKVTHRVQVLDLDKRGGSQGLWK